MFKIELRPNTPANLANRCGLHKVAFPMSGSTPYHYYLYYADGIRSFFHGMGPGSYTALLVGVWLFGFALLKSGARK